jgi:hypothetical protein
MGLTAGLDVVGKRKKSLHCPCWESNPGRPSRGLVAILTELPRLLICKCVEVIFRHTVNYTNYSHNSVVQRNSLLLWNSQVSLPIHTKSAIRVYLEAVHILFL